jgi:hypothetical protein
MAGWPVAARTQRADALPGARSAWTGDSQHGVMRAHAWHDGRERACAWVVGALSAWPACGTLMASRESDLTWTDEEGPPHADPAAPCNGSKNGKQVSP